MRLLRDSAGVPSKVVSVRNQVTVLRRLCGYSREDLETKLKITKEKVDEYEARGVQAVQNSIAALSGWRDTEVSMAEVDRTLFLLALQYRTVFMDLFGEVGYEQDI